MTFHHLVLGIMAPKVSKFAKTAAKRKAAPKKTVQKDKTPEKAKKTREKTKPVAEEPIEEAQKQLQEKMEVDVPETKSVVKVEQVEAGVSKEDQSSFVSAAKKTNNEDMQKAYKHYQSLGRYDKQKQDRKFLHQWCFLFSYLTLPATIPIPSPSRKLRVCGRLTSLANGLLAGAKASTMKRLLLPRVEKALVQGDMK